MQGGVYRDGIILTDPVVLSRQRKFGPTDLGEKGISSFFYHHRCNRFCQSHWNKPYASRMYFSATRGSTFM